MIIKILFIFFISLTANAQSVDMISFYKDAVKNLQYNDSHKLYKQSNSLSVESKKTARFENLSADILYGSTKSKLLNNSFSTTDITITDTMDIFGKVRDDILILQLKFEQNHLLLQMQKEKLFISLVDMVLAYRKTDAILKLHKSIYKEQDDFKKKLYLAVKAGGKPEIEYERFRNILSLIKNKIIQEESVIDSMKSSLKLYAPDCDIPDIDNTLLDASQDQFLSRNLELKYNDIEAKKSIARSVKLKREWLPNAVLGVSKQFNNDPTANGDNYTLSAGLHISFNGGNFKSIEASRVKALAVKSQRKNIETAQKMNFLRMFKEYTSSKNSMEMLTTTLKSSKETLSTMQKAYLKHYRDLNNYIQTIKEFITIKEAFYSAKYKNIKNSLILNNLSKGTIYE